MKGEDEMDFVGLWRKCWNGMGVTEACYCSCMGNGRAHGLGLFVSRSGRVWSGRVRLTSGWAGENGACLAWHTCPGYRTATMVWHRRKG